MRAVRSIITDFGTPPASLRSIAASLGGVGNPLSEPAEKRAHWAEGLTVKNFAKGMDFLYFVCCMLAYDSRLTDVAQATASVLQRTEANFGILGTSEKCCGESIRKAGNEQVFQYLAQHNIETFASKNVLKIIVSSPHCYATFKNEYPGLGGDFEVVHFVQYVARLLQEGKLKFAKSIHKRVVYHDPCYLGRRNGIYDEPREILRLIPSLELIEFAESRENSLCCGGGGGRIWLETRKEERFSDIRVEQAVELGADILATACPYCLVNFKDSLLTTGKSEALEIKDISQLVALALE
jgi:Fe-S oxidoreductase